MLTTKTGYPFIQVFYNSTGSLAGTDAMTAIIIIMNMFSCLTIMAGSSRQLYAFARDEAVPFSRWVSYVSALEPSSSTSFPLPLTAIQVRPGLLVPVNAIIVIFIFASILALINIGSLVAFNVVTSLGTGTLSFSYIVTIACLVWRKTTRQPLLPSRFDMGRAFGLAVNLVALGWLCLVFVIAFFPAVPTPLLTLPSMNWSVLVFAVVFLISATYYVVYGRRVYVGPVEYVRKLE